jgi:hypothetical protein
VLALAAAVFNCDYDDLVPFGSSTYGGSNQTNVAPNAAGHGGQNIVITPNAAGRAAAEAVLRSYGKIK